MNDITIHAYDNRGAKLSTKAPEDNLWIDIEREDGVRVYVGSLYIEENDNGSVTISWGSVRNEDESWNECESVTIPAAELTPKEAA